MNACLQDRESPDHVIGSMQEDEVHAPGTLLPGRAQPRAMPIANEKDAASTLHGALLEELERLTSAGTFCWYVASGKIAVSSQFARIFGINRHTSATIESIVARVRADDMFAMRDLLDRARAGIRSIEMELRLTASDNSIKVVRLAIRKLQGRQPRLEYVGAAQDMTQQRIADCELSKARTELARLARISMLGVLSASVTHEIRQPLSGIVVNACSQPILRISPARSRPRA